MLFFSPDTRAKSLQVFRGPVPFRLLRAAVSRSKNFVALPCAGRPGFLTERGPAQRDALMNGFLRVEPLNSRVTPIPGARAGNAGQISRGTTLARLATA